MTSPAIFAILQYFPDNTFPEAGSVAITLVAIFLPLSSIWAAASIDGDAPISRWNYASNGSTYYGTNHSTLYTDHTASAVDRKGSLGPLTPASAASHVEHQPADAFASVITKGRMIGDCPGDFDRMGVRVDKSFSVRTGTLTG
jgi:pheromone alpha factor receptor